MFLFSLLPYKFGWADVEPVSYTHLAAYVHSGNHFTRFELGQALFLVVAVDMLSLIHIFISSNVGIWQFKHHCMTNITMNIIKIEEKDTFQMCIRDRACTLFPNT